MRKEIRYRQCSQSPSFMFDYAGRGLRGLKAVRTAASHFIDWWPCPGWRRRRYPVEHVLRSHIFRAIAEDMRKNGEWVGE